MKLLSYAAGDGARLGALTADHLRVVDLAAATQALQGAPEPAFASLLALIEAGPHALDRARATLEAAEDQAPEGCIAPLAQHRLTVPLRPPKLLCFSVYDQHLKNAFEAVARLRAGALVGGLVKGLGLARPRKGFYERPLYYKGSHLSVAGPGDEVLWPRGTKMMDYELELGVVLGKRGKNIGRNEASSYVFGYTCFNDFSARDLLMQEILRGVGPMKGKDFDTGNVLGPWVVTADEIPDPYDLKMRVRVNGELRGSANTGQMSHPIQNMIAEASQDEWVVPGEVFGTGAAPNGCGIESLRFLQPDDVVELEIERIGVLRNKVVRPT